MAAISEETLYTVSLTEQTLKELIEAVEEAREKSETDILNVDVKSHYSKIKFSIFPGQAESLGYKLSHIEPISKGRIIKDDS